ncbi:hypothetical protein D3C72_1301610 [compost metagenome]
MRRAANTARAEGQCVGVLLAVCDQFTNRLDRQLLAGEQEQRQLRHFGNRYQVRRLVAELRVQRHVRAVGGQHRHEGIAIRRRARRDAHTQRAVRTGLVLDDDGLPEALRDLLEHNARNCVGRTAGRIGNDDLDRFGRPGIGGHGGGVSDGQASDGDSHQSYGAQCANIDAQTTSPALGSCMRQRVTEIPYR